MCLLIHFILPMLGVRGDGDFGLVTPSLLHASFVYSPRLNLEVLHGEPVSFRCRLSGCRGEVGYFVDNCQKMEVEGQISSSEWGGTALLSSNPGCASS